MTGHLTMKSDVYAFGVVLFELLSGRRAVDTRFSEDEWNLANWAQKCVKERRLDQLVSSHIKGQISPKCLKEFAQIADRCLKNSRKERPTMAEVVVSLHLSMSLQEQFDRSVQLAAGSVRSTYKLPKYLAFGAKNNSEDGLMEYSFRIFSYSDMELATRNFGSHMLLGHGKYGQVFRGWLDRRTFTPSLSDRGLTIAVKRLKFKAHKLNWMQQNMKMLEDFNDPNIVKILGYCLEEYTVLIVYEFMHQGTLYDYLFSVDRVIERHQLISRVKIAIGIVRGLVFLRALQPQLADSPLQMHNIFLDEEFNAKLSDFDVAMLVLRSDAKLHFRPASFYDSKVKGGVFGFGVILMEMLTGKLIDYECELTVAREFLPGEHGFASMQSIRCALDGRLRFNILQTKPAIQLALLAQKCVVDESYLRPTLESVLEELEEIYDVMLKLDNNGN
ncbi:protein kinase-like domain, Concanavalin A-like lectin/glucanase domain protein [Artemisia annua]|uniref:Protein kinase-like domain, Concanavalin A-like lectin/glucanase domain protein n=1 Tax=Artemisia annua TaxID=35608 RepID=A0A2U1MWZ4_ARTAN|nr:protein kinase-like domain, Concanavalin A-like lectin/glucanase domain protein [Artemisia annua]